MCPGATIGPQRGRSRKRRYNPNPVSVFDRRRLPPEVFKLDVERMRQGWYSDKYFINIAKMLAELAAQGYRFGGSAPDLSDLDVDLRNLDVGSIEVEMQWFSRRQPTCVVVGVDKALAILRSEEHTSELK